MTSKVEISLGHILKEGDAITHSTVQFLKEVAGTLPQGCHIID